MVVSFKATLLVATLLVLQFTVMSVSAAVGCRAEANFQECKAIEERQLSACGPSDYKCQCDAQRLIQQCFNLCPEYASDAQIHSGTVESICAAVPTTSSPLPPLNSVVPSNAASATLVAPNISAASNAPAASQSAHGSGSSVTHPANQIAAIITSFVIVGIYTQF